MSKIKTDLKSALHFQRILAGLALVVLVLVSLMGPLSAQTVLQGFASDEQLQRGMFVAINENDDTKVSAVTDKTIQKMKGVVVEQNDSPVSISSEDRRNFVATSGVYDGLVSNENGKVSNGDLLTISSLAGIAAKAGETQSHVIGRAAADFEGGGDAIGSGTTKSNQVVQFGRIPVDVGLTKNPNAKNPEKDRVPDVLQKFSQTIADKPVNAVRIYIGLVVFLMTSIIAGIMLYSGTRSSLIAIGRNPLSKTTIYRGLVQVVLMSLMVFITGIFGVYLLLKL